MFRQVAQMKGKRVASGRCLQGLEAHDESCIRGEIDGLLEGRDEAREGDILAVSREIAVVRKGI